MIKNPQIQQLTHLTPKETVNDNIKLKSQYNYETDSESLYPEKSKKKTY